MYSEQLGSIRNHPYVEKIGVWKKELRSLLLEKTGMNIRFTTGQIRKAGIRYLSIKEQLAQLKFYVGGKGGGRRYSPISKINAIFVYYSQLCARLYFEGMDLQKDYDERVERGELNGVFHRRRAGLTKWNPVRILKVLYHNDGEILLKQLGKELKMISITPLKERILPPMVKHDEIKLNGEKITWSERMKKILTQNNFELWEEFKKSTHFTRLLSLDSWHLQKKDKNFKD